MHPLLLLLLLLLWVLLMVVAVLLERVVQGMVTKNVLSRQQQRQVGRLRGQGQSMRERAAPFLMLHPFYGYSQLQHTQVCSRRRSRGALMPQSVYIWRGSLKYRERQAASQT
jgi:hypothetical protein